MKVYYIVTGPHATDAIGSYNEHKIVMMYNHCAIYTCNTWEFKGKLLGYEYID
jgi:hypothetical protein